MIAASAFVAGSLIGVQGLAIALLSRRRFLRVSPVLQFVAFAVLVGGYLLQPNGFVAADLVAAQAGGLLAASPSGPVSRALGRSTVGRDAGARRSGVDWCGDDSGVGVPGIRRVVRPHAARHRRGIRRHAGRAVRRHVLAGHGPTRGLADFALTTLARSAQPRVLMAFYWGLGFAVTVAFAKTPRGQGLASAGDSAPWHEGSVPFLIASILMLGASIFAARSAFAMPRELSSNPDSSECCRFASPASTQLPGAGPCSRSRHRPRSRCYPRSRSSGCGRGCRRSGTSSCSRSSGSRWSKPLNSGRTGFRLPVPTCQADQSAHPPWCFCSLW